jgi:hypothetical protein
MTTSTLPVRAARNNAAIVGASEAIPPRRPRCHLRAALADGPGEAEASVVLANGELVRLSVSAVASLLAAGSAEAIRPCRQPTQFQKARHLPGIYFFEKTGTLVPFESLLELRNLMLLEFDPEVGSVVAQPFRLHFDAGFEGGDSHIPDVLCESLSGQFRVVDVKPRERAEKPEIQAVFAETRRICGAVGWDYTVMSEPPPVQLANVSLLHAFRRRLFDPAALHRVTQLCSLPRRIHELDLLLGGRSVARPLVFHLLWHHVLEADLTKLIDAATVVRLHVEEVRNAA